MIDDILEIADCIVDIWLAIIRIFVYIGLVVLSPLWIIPYLIYKCIAERNEYKIIEDYYDEGDR